ncbi:unnamed protein product [Linum tenue]|uniref:Mitochondrial import inner membrane translocase subunit TIM50 n=1 Tax=Linum tenue TaxID=586396 RepID=A0AAV0PFP6_9ROSI|nr:unnamed protein product [Linum tenue]
MQANLKLKATLPRKSKDEEKEVELNLDLSWLANLINIVGPVVVAPKRKLLVLGLAGLLCEPVMKRGNSFRTFKGWMLKGQNPAATVYATWPNDAGHENFVVYKRPHCQEFLKFCLERFDVAIWSTAEKWYTDNALDCVMSGLKMSDFLFIWNREECKSSGFKMLNNNNESIFLKELNKPNTAVFPPVYKFENVKDNVLAAGGELSMFLHGLARAGDVPSYVNANRFGQPAITHSHPNWAHYRKIILAHDSKKN